MSKRGEALRAKYGSGELLEIEGSVFCFGHDSEEAARAFASANLDDGYLSWIDFRNERWCSIVDVGEAEA
jgi:hypothetical protein